MNSMVKHVKSMEQGMIGPQEKFIESDNERVKQSIRIDQLIQENISTQRYLHQFIYILNDVRARVKQSSKTATMCPSVLNSVSKYTEENYFSVLLVTPHLPTKEWYQMLCMDLPPRKNVLPLQP